MMPLPERMKSTHRRDGSGIRRSAPDRAKGSNNLAANIFLHFKEVLKDFDLARTVGTSKVVMEPVGVVGIFTPWNSSAGSIAIKVAPAITCRMHCCHQAQRDERDANGSVDGRFS